MKPCLVMPQHQALGNHCICLAVIIAVCLYFLSLPHMFAETIPVDAVFLSHFPISFKNTKLQFILALEEKNVLFFLPCFEKRVSCNDLQILFCNELCCPLLQNMRGIQCLNNFKIIPLKSITVNLVG